MKYRMKIHPYFLSELKAQFISVGPITIILTLTVIIARRRLIDDFWATIGGMICAVIGLTFFIFGLKGCIMPLAEKVGIHVNEKFSLPIVLFISFVLGVLVTLAEPAVSSLRPLGKEVDRLRAPYLYYMMNDGVEWLLLSIGIGVGIAAIIGTARFIFRWPFKPLAIGSTLLCLLVSGLVSLLVEDLRPTITLAWDAGAVTTGPVTVPILLALGKGAVDCHSRRQTDTHIPSLTSMDGFGLVTFASLYPIICVHFYGLIVYSTKSKEDILSSVSEKSDTVVDRPPVREIITAIRSIAPLVLVLVIILKIFLRMDLPTVRMRDIVQENISQAPVFEVQDPDSASSGLDEYNSGSDQGNNHTDLEGPQCTPAVKYGDHNDDLELPKTENMGVSQLEVKESPLVFKQNSGSVEIEGTSDAFRQNESDISHDLPVPEINNILILPFEAEIENDFNHDVPPPVFQFEAKKSTLKLGNEINTVATENMNDTFRSIDSIRYYGINLCLSAYHSYWARECIFYESLLASQVGLMLFNIGLHYGFTSLGDQVGSLLPAMYSTVKNDEDSPLMPKGLGIFVANAFIFLLGILATRAEPGLKVLAEQVKALTHGVMKKTKTVYSVALGVGLGMVAGTSRLQFDLNMYPYLAIMYGIALFVTIFSREIVSKVAWDSAGVTTGPVTVPFVLSIGLSYARSRLLPSGFGILACASVAPIISVLLVFFPWCRLKRGGFGIRAQTDTSEAASYYNENDV